MKRTMFLAMALIAIFAVCNSFGQEVREYKRYPYKSGMIEYEITGNTYKGTATLYWDNYGMKEALYTEKVWKKAFITLHSVNQVEIVDGDYNYKIDLKDNTGTKKVNNYAEKYGNLEDLNDIINKSNQIMAELGFTGAENKSSETTEYGGVELPTGVPGVTSSSSDKKTNKNGKKTVRFCGKDCEVLKYKEKDTQLTYYVWDGITLVSDEILPNIPMVGQPQFTKKCKSVKVDISIPAEKFKIPDDAKITEK